MFIKIFKKILLLLVLVASFPLLTSMNYSLEDLILTEKDWTLEKSQTSPAITVPPNLGKPFESYNRWQCFPMEYIKFDCSEVCGKTNENIENCALENTYWIPEIFVDTDNKAFYIGYDLNLFSKPPMQSWQDCQRRIKKWQDTFYDEIGICAYSSLLQTDNQYPNEETRSLWRIKSSAHEIILYEKLENDPGEE